MSTEALTDWKIRDGAQNGGDQGDDCDRIGAQTLLLQKTEGQHLERAELNRLCRANLAKTDESNISPRSIKETAEMGKASKKTQKQAFQLEFGCKTRESRNGSHKLLPRHLFNSCRPTGLHKQRGLSLGRNVEELESGLCSGTLI